MRVWITGLLCALLGGYAVWIGVLAKAWPFAAGGAALVVASLIHIAHPGRRSLGGIALCWGALVLGHAYRTGHGLAFDNARSSGSSAAIVVAVVLVLMGLRNLLWPAKPVAKVER